MCVFECVRVFICVGLRRAVRSQVTVMFNNDYHRTPAPPTLINRTHMQMSPESWGKKCSQSGIERFKKLLDLIKVMNEQ